MPVCQYTVCCCMNTVSHSYTQYRCRTGRQHARIYESSSAQDLQDSEYVWTIKESFITEITKTLLHKFYCLPGAIQGSSVTTLRTFVSTFILGPHFSTCFVCWPYLYTLWWAVRAFTFCVSGIIHITVKLVTETSSECGLSINSILSSLLSFCHYVFGSPILCSVCGKYTNRQLMNSTQVNVCLFTKKLAFKRTYKGQTVVFFTYNSTEKGHKNLTHRTKIVRRVMYRTCQNCLAHFGKNKVMSCKEWKK